MKRRLLYWFIIGGLILGGCIEDRSGMGDKILSHITIESTQDTFLIEFGEEVRIAPKITQELEGQELRYEWRSQFSTNNDSLKFLPCQEPILSDLVHFRNVGKYKVRLRAYNDDCSSFHNYVVIVRSDYDKGFMVLSKDENKKGRLSFLRVVRENDVLTSDVDLFKTNVFEDVNPGVSLNDPTDMTFWNEKGMLLFSLADNKIQFCDKSLAYLYPLTWESPLQPSGFYVGAEDLYLLTSGKGVFSLGTDAIYKTKWTQASITKCCEYPKLSLWDRFENCLFMDFENSRIYTNSGDSKDRFADKDIVNVASDGTRVLVVLADKNNPRKLTISFNNYNLKTTSTPDYSYTTGNVTLTRDIHVVSESWYTKTAFYPVASGLYRWATSGTQPDLPIDPILTVDGEISCLALSQNYRYLYIGIHNPFSSEKLKGSVWVMEIETLQIVKKYEGIADKPIKILYKSN